MDKVPAEEGPRLGWGQILFISSAMFLISLVVWRGMSSDDSSLWQQATYWQQQANQFTPMVAIGVEAISILAVLRGRWRGWSNRSLRRLLGFLVATVIVVPIGYIIWSNVVLSPIRTEMQRCCLP
jgi:hypothetical protein